MTAEKDRKKPVPLHEGGQFTGRDWISTLQANGIPISMDGKGR